METKLNTSCIVVPKGKGKGDGPAYSIQEEIVNLFVNKYKIIDEFTPEAWKETSEKVIQLFIECWNEFCEIHSKVTTNRVHALTAREFGSYCQISFENEYIFKHKIDGRPGTLQN